MADEALLLDLNNPVFQRDLFALEKVDQQALLSTLKRLRGMTWRQVYTDQGLKWEAIHSRQGPNGQRLYSFRASRAFRAVGYRDGLWLKILSLHPDHDSAYHSPSECSRSEVWPKLRHEFFRAHVPGRLVHREHYPGHR